MHGARCPVCEGGACRSFQAIDGISYLRCGDCAATFMHSSHLPAPEREQSIYRLHRNDIADGGYRRFLDRLVAPLLQRLAPARQGLDYGCGPGPALAQMLREAGHEVALYDPLFAPDAAVLARDYDFITCSEVVEHFHRPAEEFARLDTLLRPGGWLALTTCFQTDDARFAGWHYRRDPTHVVFYRESTLHHIARRHGWQCEVPRANVALMRKQGA